MNTPYRHFLPENSSKFDWLSHNEDIRIGPFVFPPTVPVPVPHRENTTVRSHWLDIPFFGRKPMPTGYDDDFESCDAVEIFEAYEAGHLPASAPDYEILVDLVGRSLVFLLNFAQENEHFSEIVEIFNRVENPATVYGVLLEKGQFFLQEGQELLKRNLANQAILQSIFSRMNYFAAHLLSPLTTGIPYELGILSFTLSQWLSSRNADLDQAVKQEFAMESIHFLLLALADEDIRQNTPSLYVLGVNRLELGEEENAKDAFRRFLSTRQADQYPEAKAEALHHLGA